MSDRPTKKLQLDRTDLIKFVADPLFFEICPALRYLASAAAESLARFQESGKARCCGGDFAIMRRIVDAVFLRLKDLKAADPTGLAEFKEYLATRKGFNPSPLTLYYRRGNKGQIGKLVL